MVMKINVTQEDIDNGVRMNSEHCPIALAARRALPCRNIVVGPKQISWYIGEEMPYGKRGELPFEASMFIDTFDNGHLVKPFEFEVGVYNITR